MLESITKDVLRELKPSGVLNAVIEGVETHRKLPECVINLRTFGLVFVGDGGVRRYELCLATSALTYIAGTTFPELVGNIGRDVSRFNVKDIPSSTGWDSPLVTDLRITLDYIRYGKFLEIVDFYNYRLGVDFPPGFISHLSRCLAEQVSEKGGVPARIQECNLQHGLDCVSVAANLLQSEGF